MSKTTSVFLCDLTHTSQGVNAEFVPYALACIKSYYHRYGRNQADIRLFKFPDDVGPAFFADSPAVVGFSNYMWNLDISYQLAEAIKAENPETLIVFGGPNYPLENARQEEWLRDHPAVDICVVGEGEEPFRALLDFHLQHGQSIDATKRAAGKLIGVQALVDDALVKFDKKNRDGYDDAPRITDLDGTPSPYLEGYLDAFLADTRLVPLMESNRGCPFQCAFCVDGIGARAKVHKTSLGRREAELRYIADRYDGKYLILADTNFGMYKDDVEFCQIIAQVKQEKDYPHHLQVSTGKNQQARVIECADLLDGSLRFAASVQSLDEEVLSNAQRSNISFEQLMSVSQRVSGTEASTYSEVILGLPGDSLDKHLTTVGKLVDAGFNQIRLYTFMVLEGSEFGTAKQTDRHGIQHRYRVVPRSFGYYQFGDKEIRSAEIETVSVETNTLPFADYVDARRFALTVTLFYNDRIFAELVSLLGHFGVKPSQWLKHLHAMQDRYPATLKEIYDDFSAQTVNELSVDFHTLERRIREEPNAVQDYIDGKSGNNVLFNTQARAYVEGMSALHDVAFGSIDEILASVDVEKPGHLDRYLAELKKISLYRKSDFTDLKTERVETFGFDFVALDQEGYLSLPQEISETRIRIAFDKPRRELLEDQFKRQGMSLQSLGKIFSRIPIKRTQRPLRYADPVHQGIPVPRAKLEKDGIYWFGTGS